MRTLVSIAMTLALVAAAAQVVGVGTRPILGEGRCAIQPEPMAAW